MLRPAPYQVLKVCRRAIDLAESIYLLTANLVPRTLLLDDGVEAVGENPGAHGVGVFTVRKGADLDVEKLILRLVADGDCVALFLE